jgi:hypothetical protein
LGRLVIRHCDKAKPTRATGLAIRKKVDAIHHAIRREQCAQILFCDREGEMVNRIFTGCSFCANPS